MTDFLGDEEIERRLNQIEEHGSGNYYRPLQQAVESFQHFSEHPELRVRLGIQAFDDHIRGVAPGEICLIQGFAHSGKTVLATEVMLGNADTPLVLFTPDETRAAVLTKLATSSTGIGAEEFERRLYRKDRDAREILMQVAEQHRKLAVFEEHVGLQMMDIMFQEAGNAVGERPKAIIFDFATQLAEEGSPGDKIAHLKQWCNRNQTAGIILHQASRSSGSGGRQLGMDGGAYGGETDANFVINVRRKGDYYRAQLRELAERMDQCSNPTQYDRYQQQKMEILDDLMPRHRNTISIGMDKNKRLPCTKVPETDFHLDPECGRITEIVLDTPDSEPLLPVDNQMFETANPVDLLRR